MLSFIAMTIADALFQVKEKIGKSAVRAGRSPNAVTLIAVSKTVGPARVLEAIRAGATILGENRVQEAHKKIIELSGPLSGMDVRWHLIGSLQKNKAKQAVQLFDLIHSVDSAGLAGEINKAAAKIGKVQKILVQVKLSDEETKHGISAQRVIKLLEEVALMDHLSFEGIMTMPPYFDDPEQARPYFRKLRQIAEIAGARGFAVQELSMGMSHDFEAAIEEGATMVRIGTAIFGARKKDREDIAGS